MKPMQRFAGSISTVFRSPVSAAKPHRIHKSISNPVAAVAYTFFHKPTGTWTYVVSSSVRGVQGTEAVLIDPVLDFDACTNEITTRSADSLIEFLHQSSLKLTHILETHAHADHLTASQYFKRKFSSSHSEIPVCIGKNIVEVQNHWRAKYNIASEELEGVFDRLWEDDDEFDSGNLVWKVMHLPGHTPDHVGYKVDNFVFCGDSLFLPDVGSARADFPGGSPSSLFDSSQRLLALPPSTKIFSGHDYPGNERVQSCCSTVEEQRMGNKHLSEGIDKEGFIRLRQKRDQGLKEPGLLHQSIQVNIRGGHTPRDGLLHLPLKVPTNFSSSDTA